MKRIRKPFYYWIGTFLFLASLYVFTSCRYTDNDTIVVHEVFTDLIQNIAEEHDVKPIIVPEPEYEIWHFADGADATLAFDLQYDVLRREGPPVYFAPLGSVTPVMLIDREVVKEPVTNLQGLLDAPYRVYLYQKEPRRLFLWAGISYALSGTVDRHLAADFLSKLYRQDKWASTAEEAPIRIMFSDIAVEAQKNDKNLEVVPLGDHSLGFTIGWLSREPASDELIRDLRAIVPKYTPNGMVEPAIDHIEEIRSLGEIFSQIHRDVQENYHWLPISPTENLAINLIVMLFAVVLIAQAQRRIANVHVRRGYIVTSGICVLWVLVGIVKFHIVIEGDFTRYLWYSYYAFSLSFPVASLWISGHIGRKQTNGSFRFVIAAVSWLVFTIFVLTNDLHQQVFSFPQPDASTWSSDYEYRWGFYVISAWFVLTHFGSLFLMLSKGWDSPKIKMTGLPVLLFAIGIVYHTLYILGHPITLGLKLIPTTCLLVLAFWEAALISNLVPSNRNYRALFEASTVNMQIVDTRGKSVYQSKGFTPLFDHEEVNQRSPRYLPEAHSIVWKTPIQGGFAVVVEDIHSLIEQRKELKNTTLQVQRENRILSQNAQVQSDLAAIAVQNELTREVNRILEEKLAEMKLLIQMMAPNGHDRERTLRKIHRLALYCKRRCELLIWEKNQAPVTGQEICRILREIADIYMVQYTVFNQTTGEVPISVGIQAFEVYHQMVELCSQAEITTLVTRFRRLDDRWELHFLLDGDLPEIEEMLPISYEIKEMNEACAVIFTWEGEEIEHD